LDHLYYTENYKLFRYLWQKNELLLIRGKKKVDIRERTDKTYKECHNIGWNV